MAAKDNNTASYDDSEIPRGKDVEETKNLMPGAREPKSFTVGEKNTYNRDKTKHHPFGELGAMGWADD